MAKDFVFTMVKVGKIYLPKKQVLKDISLSFCHGANWRPRIEWRGKEHAVAHHGRRRERFHRRSEARQQNQRWIFTAGAAA